MHDEMSTQWNELFTTFQDGPMCSGYPACLEGKYCQEPGAALTGGPGRAFHAGTPRLGPTFEMTNRPFCLFCSLPLCSLNPALVKISV